MSWLQLLSRPKALATATPVSTTLASASFSSSSLPLLTTFDRSFVVRSGLGDPRRQQRRQQQQQQVVTPYVSSYSSLSSLNRVGNCLSCSSSSSSSSSSSFSLSSSCHHVLRNNNIWQLPLFQQQHEQQQQQQQHQVRWKHSARQLQLKIINHPSVYRRRRREERQKQYLQLLETEEEMEEEEEENDENDEQQQQQEEAEELDPNDDNNNNNNNNRVQVLIGTMSRFHRATIRAKPLYATWFTPEFLSNGWSAPPPKEEEEEASPSSSVVTTATTTSPPFTVRRTSQKPNNAIGFLPVYSCSRRKDGLKVSTRIKKVQGDVPEFVRELQAVLYQHQLQLQQERPWPPPSPPTPTSSSSSSSQEEEEQQQQQLQQQRRPLLHLLPRPPVRVPAIRIRAGGDMVEVDGNHTRVVKAWLAGLGF